jgi:hypothetical protein
MSEFEIRLVIIHKSAYITEDSDEEEAPRRKRQRAEKAAAGELDEEEVSLTLLWIAADAIVEPFVLLY